MTEGPRHGGGTGYLAGWVIAGLLERGYRVRTTVRDVGKASLLLTSIGERVGPDRLAALEIVTADLLADEGWAAAAAGTEFVVHPASPIPLDAKADLVATAREGTRRVLIAAADAGTRRVVVTSSALTAMPQDSATIATEDIRSEPVGTRDHRYPDSKILAERDAWSIAAATGMEVTAILPTFMQGPPIGARTAPGTIDIMRRLVSGALPAIPRIGWNIVDVRDVAELHIRALENAAAAGQRLLASGTFLWYSGVAEIVRRDFPDAASNVPTRRMPNTVIRALALVNPQLASIRPELGRTHFADSAKAREDLGWTTRDVEATIRDTVQYLLTRGS
ncbi:NAD-dependent epimerase/dehydratase family protein [Microbacterium sp. ASV49]|uniref:NAD-dependent epimerase/dehydratase family protein n=1 Tax=Microbacterium candidum TaxID=3041922 RepID=A0ABT7MW84_9MICO|nr:NAD-dependent epimerase/dehydratase family protein [Microbacterium sp. ASV49]MDL9978713.1 NAD-dependent epimerase/dehydratase family protein [Microbacterium sp. ASV49]